MKTILSFTVLAVFMLIGCNSKEIKDANTDITEEQLPVGYFGEEINDLDVSSLDRLVAILETENEFQGKVVGEINEICSKKGCWMTIDLPNGESMRVTFKDYGFFVPKNAQGYPVIIEGIATKKVTDVATLKHYAEDAGKSVEEIEAIKAPKKEYAFEAIGVIIRDNA